MRGEGQRDSNLHPCAGPYNPTPSLESSLCRGEVAHKTKARPPTRSGLALCVFVASTQTCTDCSVHSREVTPCTEPVLLDLENHPTRECFQYSWTYAPYAAHVPSRLNNSHNYEATLIALQSENRVDDPSSLSSQTRPATPHLSPRDVVGLRHHFAAVLNRTFEVLK